MTESKQTQKKEKYVKVSGIIIKESAAKKALEVGEANRRKLSTQIAFVVEKWADEQE